MQFLRFLIPRSARERFVAILASLTAIGSVYVLVRSYITDADPRTAILLLMIDLVAYSLALAAAREL